MSRSIRFVASAVLGVSILSISAYAVTTSGSGSSTNGVTIVQATATPTPTPTPEKTVVAATSIATSSATPFLLGAQTHFSQGWNPSVLSLASQVGVKNLRDSVVWSTAERTVGSYDFSTAYVQTLLEYCATGGKLSLTIVPKNPLYDGGKSVYTDQGRKAFAAYIDALLGRFRGCVSAIEVSNEINNNGVLDYPTGYDVPSTYVASLKTLYAQIKPRYPDVAILGGSVNSVATGFLEPLFAAGALRVIDGVAVHPYRADAEGLDLEINHLRDVMARYGTPVKIWATEFSYDTTDKRLAAAGLLKSAAQLNSSGVDRAYWYALIDQQWFPNMGLFTGNAIKPVGTAYQVAMQRLFAYGPAVRVNTGDSLVYLYRFGGDRWLVWGAPRTISFNGSPVIRDVLGNALAGTSVQIGAEPVMVEGATGYTLAASNVVADSMLQYGAAPWSYFRRGTDGKDVSLPLFDTSYTSYFGDRWSKPLRINNNTAAPAGDATAPMRAIMRYTAMTAQQLDLDACFAKAVTGDGVDYRIERNGVLVASGVLIDKTVLRAVSLNVAAGDRIDLSFGPNKTYGGDSFYYRAVLSARGKGTAPACS